jgi:hypothetical protein
MQSHRISAALCVAVLVVASAGCGRKADTGTTTTTPATGVRVTDVSVGRAIGGDKAITDVTDTFKPNDTIYASVATDGSAQSATLRAKWTFEDGQVVNDSTHTIAPNKPERTEFHTSKPDGWPAGKYKVEVFLDNQTAGTKSFAVRAG